MKFLGILLIACFVFKESWCLSILRSPGQCNCDVNAKLAGFGENINMNYVPIANNAVPTSIGDVSISEITPNLQLGEIVCNGELPITGTINVKGFFPVYGTVTVDGAVPTSGVAVVNTGSFGNQGLEISPCAC